MIKQNSLQGCKDSSISENKSMWHTTQKVTNKNHTIISMDAAKLLTKPNIHLL